MSTPNIIRISGLSAEADGDYVFNAEHFAAEGLPLWQMGTREIKTDGLEVDFEWNIGNNLASAGMPAFSIAATAVKSANWADDIGAEMLSRVWIDPSTGSTLPVTLQVVDESTINPPDQDILDGSTEIELSYPYCSVDDVMREIGMSQDQLDLKMLNRIKGSINEASRFIDQYCGRTFYRRDHSVVPLLVRRSNPRHIFSGKDFYIPLSCTPVQNMISVEDDGVALTLWEDYGFDEITGVFTKTVGEWGSTIKIHGLFGYSPNIRAVGSWMNGRVRTACKEIAASFTGENRRERVSLDGGTVSVLEKSIPKSAISMLAGMRRVVV